MTIATALALLSRRSAANRAEVFPLRSCATSPVDTWPLAATAAVMLTGWLDDAETDTDLDGALNQFQSLFFGGVVSKDEWAAAIMEVSATVRQSKQRRGEVTIAKD